MSEQPSEIRGQFLELIDRFLRSIFPNVPTLIVQAVVTFFAAVFAASSFLPDREAKEKKELLDSQVDITKIFYDVYVKITDDCEKPKALTSLVEVSKKIASYYDDRHGVFVLANDFVKSELGLSKSDAKVEACEEDVSKANENVGEAEKKANTSDAEKKAGKLCEFTIALRKAIPVEKASCPGNDRLDVSPSKENGAEIALPQAGTRYDTLARLGAAVAPPAAKAGAPYTIYIQYKKGDNAALVRAEKLRDTIARSQNLIAPGIEGVAAVPNVDQIRVYRSADSTIANRLMSETFGLSDATIVNLAVAYPNLPPNVMEVWLKP
jgi:hypothetical protein